MTQVLRADAEVVIPLRPFVDPVLVPGLVLARRDEELHLHLLELTGPEDEVTRGDLVAERLADLADSERRLAPGRRLDVRVVDENALGRLRTQVGQAGGVLDRAQVGLEQAVEHPRLGERATRPAVRAGDLGERRRRPAAPGLERLLQMVGAEPLVAGQALGQRVDEDLHVAAGLPDLAGEDHARVEADDVLPALDHGLPPGALDVVLQLDPERTVVPRGPQATVDLARGEDQPPALAQTDDGVHAVGCTGHAGAPFLSARCRR